MTSPQLPRAYITLEGPIHPLVGTNPKIEPNFAGALAQLERWGFFPWIVTSGPANSEAAIKKMGYVARYLPDLANRVHFTSPGTAFGSEGDIRIGAGQLEEKFPGATFPFNGWEETLSYLQRTLALLEKAATPRVGVVSLRTVMESGRLDAGFNLVRSSYEAEEALLKAAVSPERATHLLNQLPLPLQRMIYEKIAVGSGGPTGADTVYRHLHRTPYLALALAAQLAPVYVQQKRQEVEGLLNTITHVSELQESIQEHLKPAVSRKARP